MKNVNFIEKTLVILSVIWLFAVGPVLELSGWWGLIGFLIWAISGITILFLMYRYDSGEDEEV